MRLFSGVVACSLLAACTGGTEAAPEMTSADRSQIQAEVLDWSDQWLESGTNLEAQGVAHLFDEADGHFVDGGQYLATWQAYLTHSQELYRSWESWEGQWGSRRIDVLADDAALFVGQVESVITTDEGVEADVQSTFSFVLRKKEGVWKGLFGQVGGVWTPRQ
jgi:ketosteroid isomerase-like protein